VTGAIIGGALLAQPSYRTYRPRAYYYDAPRPAYRPNYYYEE
jgi:hypothetical protein